MAIKTVVTATTGPNQAGFAYDSGNGNVVYIGFLTADASYPIYVTYTNNETGESFTAPDALGNEIVMVRGLTYDAETGATNFGGTSGTL